MTSARPSTHGSDLSGNKSYPCRTAPFVDNPVAGTQDEAITYMLSGPNFALSNMKRMPSRPSTLAISCGSVMTVVVPRGTTARANSAGGTSELSMWTWASMKPGATNEPARSTSARAG